MNKFPAGFLWGAATAAHQVEGNNFNSDLWVLEHVEPTLFAEPSLDYCDRSARHLGDLIAFATTFNEPNLPTMLRWVANLDIPFTTVSRMRKQAARAVGSDRFGCFFLADAAKTQDIMLAAHHRGRRAM